MKRALDILVALAGLLLGLPFLCIVALLIRFRLGSPVLFSQRRPGLNGRIFTMWKFRTMTNAAGKGGRLLSDAERLTPLGRMLRSTSIDEFPELWNVLKGDMSLVGPRPLLVSYLDRYSPEEARRHNVKPGITGWAQVNGRNALAWDEKFRLDSWYVDNRSFLLDLKILAMTFVKVFDRKTISAEGEATMPEFKGSRIGAGGPGDTVKTRN